MTNAAPPSAASSLATGIDAVAILSDFSDALRRGDAQAALAAARDAFLVEPNRAEAHYAFGQAWMAAGNPARAEQAFGIAAKLRPGFADAWVNYGLARYAQGAVEDAKRAMVTALRAQPGHPVATSNLAALLRLTGGYQAAETLLREALARNPHDVGARLNLVAECLQEEQPGDALALLNEVDPPADDLPAARHWHLQRALALIALGRPDKARTALAEFDALGPAPPELTPLRLWRNVVLALSEGRQPAARSAAAAMEAALEHMGPAAVLEHKIMARYDLAKFWSREGDAAQALAQWRAGHALLRPLQPFSREARRAYDDAAIAAFTPERLAARYSRTRRNSTISTRTRRPPAAFALRGSRLANGSTPSAAGWLAWPRTSARRCRTSRSIAPGCMRSRSCPARTRCG